MSIDIDAERDDRLGSQVLLQVIAYGALPDPGLLDRLETRPGEPIRDRVLLVEQFRAGPYARGDAQSGRQRIEELLGLLLL